MRSYDSTVTSENALGAQLYDFKQYTFFFGSECKYEVYIFKNGKKKSDVNNINQFITK